MQHRVLVVCSEAPPQVGGIASLLEVFCRELARRGDRVHAILRPGADPALADVVHPRLAWPRRGAANVPLQLWNATMLRALVRQHDFTRVVFFDAAARLYGLPIAPTVPARALVHGTELRAPSWSSELQSRRLWLQRRAMQRVDRVFVVSHAIAALARDAVPGLEPIVLHPCYDVRRAFDPARHRERPFDDPAGTFILLTVSRLTERKGHAQVLRMLARVRAQLPPMRYYIVGEGPHRPVLERLVAGLELGTIVRFVGAVPTESLGAWYHFADLFVMLSTAAREGIEGFGLTYIEAALSGTASLASRHGGVVDAVQHDITGYTVDVEARAETDAAFVALVRDESRRRRYADAGRRWAEAELAPERFAERLLA